MSACGCIEFPYFPHDFLSFPSTSKKEKIRKFNEFQKSIKTNSDLLKSKLFCDEFEKNCTKTPACTEWFCWANINYEDGKIHLPKEMSNPASFPNIFLYKWQDSYTKPIHKNVFSAPQKYYIYAKHLPYDLLLVVIQTEKNLNGSSEYCNWDQLIRNKITKIREYYGLYEAWRWNLAYHEVIGYTPLKFTDIFKV